MTPLLWELLAPLWFVLLNFFLVSVKTLWMILLLTCFPFMFSLRVGKVICLHFSCLICEYALYTPKWKDIWFTNFFWKILVLEGSFNPATDQDVIPFDTISIYKILFPFFGQWSFTQVERKFCSLPLYTEIFLQKMGMFHILHKLKYFKTTFPSSPFPKYIISLD